ncbi:MAG TPA: hypothetical protein VJ962_00680 [Clostridia bacterium]|nr:hypothetical protein [Clostridia bacterium]
MKKKENKQKGLKERDYDQEIKIVFDEALKEMDPELMETIKVVSQMNEAEANKFEVTTFSNGTVSQESVYAG